MFALPSMWNLAIFTIESWASADMTQMLKTPGLAQPQ